MALFLTHKCLWVGKKIKEHTSNINYFYEHLGKQISPACEQVFFRGACLSSTGLRLSLVCLSYVKLYYFKFIEVLPSPFRSFQVLSSPLKPSQVVSSLFMSFQVLSSPFKYFQFLSSICMSFQFLKSFQVLSSPYTLFRSSL